LGAADARLSPTTSLCTTTQNDPSNIAFQVPLFWHERKADTDLARRKAQKITRHSPDTELHAPEPRLFGVAELFTVLCR
jgi:hypothetical protein